MNLDAIIRSALGTANKITASLQSEVQHFAWIGQDAFGNKVYAPPVTITAVVEQKQRWKQIGPNNMVMSIARVVFVQPLTPNGSPGRTEPIDVRDKIVLPDGSTGPIVDMEGVIDSSTNRPYAPEVWLGQGEGAA